MPQTHRGRRRRTSGGARPPSFPRRFAAVLGFLLLTAAPSRGAEPFDPLRTEAKEKHVYVLAEFFSRSCPVCRDAHPVAKAAAARHRAVLLQRHDADKETELATRYGVRCVPVYVVIDPEGAVRFNDVGPRTADEFDALLEKAGAKRR